MSDDSITNIISELSVVSIKGKNPKVLIIEPFYGGSHKELINNLLQSLSDYTLVTLPAKKWHWRSRCGALCLFNIIPEITTEKVLFCSSVLNLAELVGIRPDLYKLTKIIYFHENQLIYPVQEIKTRDVQYPYNQITSCLAADKILFNSRFNKDSFLGNIKRIIRLIPDHRPKNLETVIDEKSEVLYFPIRFPKELPQRTPLDAGGVLRIVWPHRWEFDKGPEEFFGVLFKLKSNGLNFKLSILGERYNEMPEIISKAKDVLKSEIVHCGYIQQKDDYFKVLSNCDVSVSTSKHEFFGVAMIETVYCGCFPLMPNNLVYPEIYPKNCLYSDLDELYKRLKCYCQFPQLAVGDREAIKFDVNQYSTDNLIPKFIRILSPEESNGCPKNLPQEETN